VLQLINLTENNYDKASKIHDARNYFITALFGLFLVFYSATFLILLSKLKATFPSYFEQNKHRLYLMGLFIFGSLLVQAIFRGITSASFIDKVLQTSIIENTWAYPLISFLSFIAMFFIPFVVLLYSLDHSIK
jgi:hypothetical protein